MRPFAIVLCAATISLAIPLRKDASLGYRVVRGWEHDTTIATLKVLDAGDSVRVAIRDSVIGSRVIRLDTAVLHGGKWQKPSCLAAWDPEPAKGDSEVRWFGHGLQGTADLPFGMLAGACFEFRKPDGAWGTGKLMDSYERVGAAGTRTFRLFEAAATALDPVGDWASDTGWVRLQDDVSQEEWRLESVDGQRVGAHASDITARLLGPSAMMQWYWQVVNSSTSSRSADGTGYNLVSTSSADTVFVHWTRTEELADSAGWVRWTMAWDSICWRWQPTRRDGTLDFRFQRSTGVVKPEGELAGGMVRLWSDAKDSSGTGIWHRRAYERSENSGMGASGSESSSDMSVSDVHGLLGSTHIWCQVDMFSSSSSSREITFLQHERSQEGLAVRIRPQPENGLTGWRRYVASNPSAWFAVRDLEGRTKVLDARSTQRFLESHRGVHLLESLGARQGFRGKVLTP